MAQKQKSHTSLAHVYLLVLIASLGVGLGLPQYGIRLFPLVTILLGCIFFFSSLKLHVQDVIDTVHDWKTITIATILKLFALPIFVYYAARILAPDLALPFLILTAMPTAMTAPLFTSMAHGKQSFSLTLSIITSLLVPLSAPFIIQLVASSSVSVDITHIALRLGMIILIPILLAEMIKYFTPSIGGKLTTISRPASLTALGLLLVGIISAHASTIIDIITTKPGHYLLPLTLLFLATHILAYLLFFWLPYKKRIAATVSIAYMNFTLAIFISTTFFPEDRVLIPLIISAIPWSIAIIPFAEFAAHHEHT